ncbi:MAG: primosomal protein N' [Candidatus Margulisiibacteriota bacterium]
MIELTPHQEKALELINNSPKQTILLYGVTGSGKTEVYLRAIAEVLKNKQSAIALVPEISLTPQLVRRFRERFYDHIAILHSGLTIKERDQEWQKAAEGKAQIVLGTRSAIFAPLSNLGLVVLDEEYETTYKQEKNPRYHAREIAEQLGVTVILGSATPSIETFYKAQTGVYKIATLPERIDNRPLPPVEVVDMREEKAWMLSQRLRNEIKETLSRGEKVILFLNRRGYFTYAQCKECGSAVECPQCSVALVYHNSVKKLICGHCGLIAEAQVICPKCQNASISFRGIGTQRIESEVAQVYPQAKIIRLDRDVVVKRGSHEVSFAAFAEGDADVLIGTQLVTKGMDVASVTLVGVVSADTSLNLPDFRAAERTFQQLTQVAGRAGRHHLPGKVIVQTFNPEHYAIKYAAKHDYEGFYKEEIKEREELFYPPFSRLINLVISSKDEKKAEVIAQDLGRLIKLPQGKYQLLGPAPAPIAKIRGQYRYFILLKGEKIDPLREAVGAGLKKLVAPFDIRINMDIDPLDMV